MRDNPCIRIMKCKVTGTINYNPLYAFANTENI
jgi:hypothetical protein